MQSLENWTRRHIFTAPKALSVWSTEVTRAAFVATDFRVVSFRASDKWLQAQQLLPEVTSLRLVSILLGPPPDTQQEKWCVEQLSIEHCYITHEFARGILSFVPQLESLSILFCEFADAECLNEMLSNVSLRSVALLRAKLNASTIDRLKALSNIETLAVLHSDLTTPQAVDLLGSNFPRLHDLNLSGNPLSDEVLLAINRRVPNLRRLALSGVPLEGLAFQHWTHCEQLQVLDLSRSSITGHGIKSLARLTGLQELFLEDTNVTDTQMHVLCSRLPLRSLWVANTSLTDRSIKYLVECKTLRECQLSGTQITSAGVKELQAQRPELVVRSDW